PNPTAAELCSQMEGQLQSWRTYTPSMSKPGLNLLVGEWAARNGIDMLALARDRDRVDAIASAQCPEVRSEALEALQIPTLASALVGF
ncbi:lipoprotein, partial [Rhodococcus rhodochrous KG-21]